MNVKIVLEEFLSNLANFMRAIIKFELELSRDNILWLANAVNADIVHTKVAPPPLTQLESDEAAAANLSIVLRFILYWSALSPDENISLILRVKMLFNLHLQFVEIEQVGIFHFHALLRLLYLNFKEVWVVVFVRECFLFSLIVKEPVLQIPILFFLLFMICPVWNGINLLSSRWSLQNMSNFFLEWLVTVHTSPLVLDDNRLVCAFKRNVTFPQVVDNMFKRGGRLRFIFLDFSLFEVIHFRLIRSILNGFWISLN